MRSALAATLLALALFSMTGCCCCEGVPVSLENLSNWWHFHGPACRHYPNSCPECPYFDYQQCCWHPLECGLVARCPTEAASVPAAVPAAEPGAAPPPAPAPEPVPPPPAPAKPTSPKTDPAKPAPAAPAKREVRRLPAIDARPLDFPQSSLDALPERGARLALW